MPLAFSSLSHPVVAFGFFNIQTDLLLLDRLFFFADRFCTAVETLASGSSCSLPGWRIEREEDRGDLHGAIAGVDLSGFIGATYRRWPFPPPDEPARFKQQPEGVETQGLVEEMIAAFGVRLDLPLGWDQALGVVSVGEHRFSDPQFAELVAYVDRGGYPRWRDEMRPAYVRDLLGALGRLRSPWLARVEGEPRARSSGSR